MGLLDFLKRNRPESPDERFLGRWQLIKTDGDFGIGEGVTMTFTDNGKLTYVIHQKESKQIMNLIYRIEGKQLITDQPSDPRKESTEFSFDAEGNLVLDYGGSKGWFVRA
jgi:hypothetical protein